MTPWQYLSLFLVGFFFDIAYGKYIQATGERRPLQAAFFSACLAYMGLFIQRLYNLEQDIALPYIAGLAVGSAVVAWPRRQG